MLAFDSIGQVQRSTSLLVRSIFDQVLAHGEAHENLRVLCKDIGHRLNGSPSADQAIQWGVKALTLAGADTVYIMPVNVPSWTRGDLAEGRAKLPGEPEEAIRISLAGRFPARRMTIG